jgi:hypothetical protein
MDTQLCQPSTILLVVATAGVIYHLLAGSAATAVWWLFVGVIGGAVFQGLCYGGLTPIAWILMSIPILVVCFFFAVALFTAKLRIKNIEVVPCGKCRRHHPREERCHHEHHHARTYRKCSHVTEDE